MFVSITHKGMKMVPISNNTKTLVALWVSLQMMCVCVCIVSCILTMSRMCVLFCVVLIEKEWKKIQGLKTHPDPALAYGGLFDICGKNSAKLIVKNNVPKGTRVSISVSVIDIASKLILGLRFLVRCCCCFCYFCVLFILVDTMSP